MLGCYRVVQTNQTDYTWELPIKLMNLLMLNENDSVGLNFGSATATARVCSSHLSDTRTPLNMGLSLPLSNLLKIPSQSTVFVNPKGNKHFQLGPLIGILTIHTLIAGNRLKFYKTYAELNKNNGVLFVFSGRDINTQKLTISGYYYDNITGGWHCKEFPFPDVVIDRCCPNNYLYHNILEKVIGTKIFNKKNKIDKVDFFNVLHADEFLKDYIPNTRVFGELSDLEYFLDKYNEVYLKPIDSMRGSGIVKVKHISQNSMECSYVLDGTKIICQIPFTYEGVLNLLEHAAGRRRLYIVQQPISSLEYKNGPFTIRTWAMKNGNGQWIMPGMCAMGSFGNGFLTNFSAGAEPIPLKKLFNSIIPYLIFTKNQLTNFIEELTIKTAICLDKQHGPLGVLGLDIMIDNDGKLWLIEANGNPGKKTISAQPEYPSWSIQAYQNPLDYATYLAGFNQIDKPNDLTNSLLSSPKKSEIHEVQNKPDKERLIKASLIIAKEKIQKVGELQITAPIGVGVDQKTGNLTIPVQLEIVGEPVLKAKIIDNKLINEGFVPAKIFTKDSNFYSETVQKFAQQVFIPFHSIVEIKGIKPSDDVEEKFTVESTSVMGVPGICDSSLAGSVATLFLRVILKVEILISRNCIISIPAQIIEN